MPPTVFHQSFCALEEIKSIYLLIESFQPNEPSIEYKSHVFLLYDALPKNQSFVEGIF